MIGLLELLRVRGLDENARAKMVRHEDPRYPVADLVRDGVLEEYQCYQKRPVFNCQHIVSFLGRPQSRALLFGVYQVEGVTRCNSKSRTTLSHYQQWATPGHYFYKLRRLDAFSDLAERVVIDWGASTRSWHQWLRDREVVEILPSGFVAAFPGYESVHLTHEELSRIIRDEAANRLWHRMLGAVSAVYLIVDRSTGRQYVGSASGTEGLLQRWASYAKTGHGGNKLLKEAAGPDKNHCRHFSFSILQTFPRVTPLADVLAAESLHKAKLGTRAHGLNDN